MNKTEKDYTMQEISKKSPKHKTGRPLLKFKMPIRCLNEIVLNEQQTKKFHFIILEYINQRLLKEHGMSYSKRLMFSGKTGRGKTLAAEIIAYETDQFMACVDFSHPEDDVHDSINQVLRFAAINSIVVVFKCRRQEERRPLLELLESYDGQGIIVLETDLPDIHHHCFDVNLHFGLLSEERQRRLVHNKMLGMKRQFSLADKKVLRCFNNVPPFEVDHIVTRAYKIAVMAEENLTLKHIKAAI